MLDLVRYDLNGSSGLSNLVKQLILVCPYPDAAAFSRRVKIQLSSLPALWLAWESCPEVHRCARRSSTWKRECRLYRGSAAPGARPLAGPLRACGAGEAYPRLWLQGSGRTAARGSAIGADAPQAQWPNPRLHSRRGLSRLQRRKPGRWYKNIAHCATTTTSTAAIAASPWWCCKRQLHSRARYSASPIVRIATCTQAASDRALASCAKTKSRPPRGEPAQILNAKDYFFFAGAMASFTALPT